MNKDFFGKYPGLEPPPLSSHAVMDCLTARLSKSSYYMQYSRLVNKEYKA